VATTKAGQKAVHKYVKENYGRLNITVPKGRKPEIQAAADKARQSLNGYVTQAIDERMERDSGAQEGAG
jgi:predicted HicB family RNase H-like nuclease